MKKVEQISLQGAVFTIEQDAKERLANYLQKAKSAIEDEEIAKDVMTDLESSIAEHLRQAGFDRNHAVDDKSIQEVIELVGPVESGDELHKHSTDSWKSWFKEPFIPSNDKVIFGVCGTIAERLEIDAIWVRALFVVVAFVTHFWFFLVYIAFGVLLDISKPKSQRQYAKSIQKHLQDSAPKEGWRGVLQNVDRGVRRLLQGLVKVVSIVGLIGTLSAGTALILTMLGRNTDLAFIGTNRSSMAYIFVISATALAFWFFVFLLQTAFFPTYKYTKSLVRTLLLIAPFIIFTSMLITSAVYLRPTVEEWARTHPNNHFLNVERDENGGIHSSCVSLTGACDSLNRN